MTYKDNVWFVSSSGPPKKLQEVFRTKTGLFMIIGMEAIH